MECKLSAWAATLVTRDAGQAVREQAEAGLRDREHVVLDFDGVETVSNSFADEVLGKLVQSMGLAECKARIHVTNVGPLVRPVLHRAIARRLMVVAAEAK